MTRAANPSWLFLAYLIATGICAGAVWTAGRNLSAEPAFRRLASDAPTRIVSVNITSDEILIALAPERLVSVSHLAVDPDVSSVAREAERIPVKIKADAERILSLDPDLVAIGAHSADVARQIEHLGIPVLRIQGFESFDWIRTQIRTLGQAIGEPLQAERLIAEMDQRLTTVTRRTALQKRPTVLYYSSGGFTAGKDTIFDDIIHAAGGENLAAQLGISGWKKLSLEYAVVSDPEVILVTDSKWWTTEFSQEFSTHPALRDCRAIRNGRVYTIPRRLMMTASHHVTGTVEYLARLLHPDAFQGSST
jgi:iron complex transport system substrate-binding protein